MGRLVTESKQILAQLEREIPKVTKSTAYMVLNHSNELVPQPGKSRGYATGPLRASGHVIGDDGDLTEYDKAVAAAIKFDKGRVLRREQIEVPSVPPKRADTSHFRVCYPLDYAAAIHDGFYHVRAKRFIIGTAYLLSAMNANEAAFFEDMADCLKRIGNIHVLSDAELESKARTGELALFTAAQRRETQELRREFRGNLPREELRLQIGPVKGVSRTGKEIRFRETMRERADRLEVLFQAWLQVRGSDER